VYKCHDVHDRSCFLDWEGFWIYLKNHNNMIWRVQKSPHNIMVTMKPNGLREFGSRDWLCKWKMYHLQYTLPMVNCNVDCSKSYFYLLVSLRFKKIPPRQKGFYLIRLKSNHSKVKKSLFKVEEKSSSINEFLSH
jgi:hypothetical protein